MSILLVIILNTRKKEQEIPQIKFWSLFNYVKHPLVWSINQELEGVEKQKMVKKACVKFNLISK
jgi:hypothetical protein